MRARIALAVPVVFTIVLTTAGFGCPSGKMLNPEGFTPDNQTPRTCEDGWVKYEGNPVFNKGAAGEWDEGGVTCFTVRHFPWGYMMWYSCAAAFDNGFGLATSDDGVNWSRNGNNPVMVPDSGSVWGPEVLHDGERYRMWYVCNATGSSGIYYAWSDDGISWTQSEHNPVIDHGGCVAVIWDGGQYRMFLQHSTRRQHGFELLVSQDGETWESRGFTFASGVIGEWDEITAAPSVAYYEGQLHLWYTGADTVDNRRGEIAIGHAVSDDWGDSWIIPDDRTELRQLRPTEAWEGRGLYSSGVDYDEEKIAVWYAATGPDGGFGFASREINSTPPTIEPDRAQPSLWTVAPNPSSGSVRIRYLGSMDVGVTVGIYDLSGREVFSCKFEPNAPIIIPSDKLGLPLGEYLLRISAKERLLHSQAVILK